MAPGGTLAFLGYPSPPAIAAVDLVSGGFGAARLSLPDAPVAMSVSPTFAATIDPPRPRRAVSSWLTPHIITLV